MSSQLINELQELVINVCDDLYAQRQLITKNVVKTAILTRGEWDSEYLDMQLPTYINHWRINTISQKEESLEAELARTKNELNMAHKTIALLQAQHDEIVQYIKGILHG